MSDKATQLLEAAIDLFAKEGFWNTPTSRIAKHAGVATGTLFNYFESKDALIDAVYLQLKHEWSVYVVTDVPEQDGFKAFAEHIWFRSIEWGVQNNVRHTLMIQLRLSNLVSAEAQRIQDEGLQVGLAMIQQGINDGVIVDMAPDYFGMLMTAHLETAVQYATKQSMHGMTLARHIAQGFELFWRGVAR